MEKLRLLIAEDNDGVRNFVGFLLSNNYQIVGAVANGEELVRSALCLMPDIIVSDISMPLMDGFEARNNLAAQGKIFPFVFLTSHGKEILGALPTEGAVALVHKLELTEQLDNALNAVCSGSVWLSPFYRP